MRHTRKHSQFQHERNEKASHQARVDRMWVIVKARTERGYIGVLDNDPGTAENLHLREGDSIPFGPEHIAEIGNPPREYVIKKYGASFFDE